MRSTTGTSRVRIDESRPAVGDSLNDLDERSRSIVDVLTLTSDAVSDRVAEVAGIKPASVGAALTGLVDDGLVRLTLDNLVELRSKLVRAVAAEQLTEPRRTQLRRRFIAVLAQQARNPVALAEQLLELSNPTDGELDLTDQAVDTACGRALYSGDTDTAVEIGDKYLARVGTTQSAGSARSNQPTIALLARSPAGSANRGPATLAMLAQRVPQFDDPALCTDLLLARGPIDTGAPVSAELIAHMERVLHRLPASDVGRRTQLRVLACASSCQSRW